MLVEWLDTVSNQSILLPLLCREKHFLAQLTAPIQIFLRLRYLSSYCLERHLQLHLPIISSKQLTMPENQQLEEWSMETAILGAGGTFLLCTQVLVFDLYDHALWQGEK